MKYPKYCLKLITFILLFFLCANFQIVFAQTNQSTINSNATGQVKGLLVYEKTGEPVEGLYITLPRASIVNEGIQALIFDGSYAKTDKAGAFKFDNVQPGIYFLYLPPPNDKPLANGEGEAICEVTAGMVTDFGKFRLDNLITLVSDGGIVVTGELRFNQPIPLKEINKIKKPNKSVPLGD